MAKAVSDKQLIAALSSAVERLGGVVVGRVDGDAIVVAFDGVEVSVFLDNLRRRVAGGETLADAAAAFARSIAPGAAAVLPTTHAAIAPGLRTMLEQREVAVSSDALRRELSPELAVCLVWTDPHEASVVFLSEAMLAGLNVDDAWQIAAHNMDALLRATPLEIDDAARPLGMLSTASAFKASLLTAPALRAKVEASLGWPVRAVAPCRDFVFVFRADDDALLPRLAKTVMRELGASPYPLTAEVLEIADAGLRALGSFRPAPEQPLPLLLKLLSVEVLAPSDGLMRDAIDRVQALLTPETRFDAESLAVLLESTRDTTNRRLQYLERVLTALDRLSIESRAVVAYLAGWIAFQTCRFATSERYFRAAATAFPYSIEAGLAHTKCLLSEPLVDYAVALDDEGEPTREPKKRARSKAEQRAADAAVIALPSRLDRVGSTGEQEALLVQLHREWFGEEVGEADVLILGIDQSKERGDAALTLAYCERLTKLRPTFFKAWGQRALELTKLSRHEQAVVAYAEAIEVFTAGGSEALASWPGPDPRGQLFFNRACELAFVGRKDESLRDLRAAIGYHPHWAEDAKSDDYFEALWQDEDFVAVVSGAGRAV